MRHPALGAILIAAALSVSACAGVDPAEDPVYRDASRHLADARADPVVARYAKIPLIDASKTLQQALQAEDLTQLHHLSYLGLKKVDIARAVAETREADEALESLKKRQRAAALTSRQRRAPLPPSSPPPAPKAETKPPPPPVTEKDRAAPPPGPDDAAARAAVAAAAAAAAREAAQARRLAQALPDFKIAEEDNSTVITLPEESFPTGATTLNGVVGARLGPLVDFLKDNADRKVIVTGHTDDTGNPQENIRISNARAESVKSRLVAMGIGETRILTIGYGHNRPIASNQTAEGRRANRRVEVVLMHTNPRSDATAPSSVGLAPGGPVQRPGRE